MTAPAIAKAKAKPNPYREEIECVTASKKEPEKEPKITTPSAAVPKVPAKDKTAMGAQVVVAADTKQGWL